MNLSEEIDTEEDIEKIEHLIVDRSSERGPFDIIGDVHGCFDELCELLAKLGYFEQAGMYRHRLGRRVIFLGDLVNRGPNSVSVVRLAASMLEAGTALYVRGNHCQYVYGFFKKYSGPDYNRPRKWLEELGPVELTEFSALFCELVSQAPPYLMLDEGKLVVSHAGIEADMIGQLSRRIFDFCLYGEYTGELHPTKGYPLRRDWAATYQGEAFIAYGHTPTAEVVPEIRYNSVNLDQGCVFGGCLSAMRYPEMEFVQVKAARAYQKLD